MSFFKSLLGSGVELNKLAENVARVKIQLDKLNALDTYNMDDYKFIAYMCRATILDRVERNNWFLDTLKLHVPINGNLCKVTYHEAFMMSVGRLSMMISSFEEDDKEIIMNILDRGEHFHAVDRTIPEEKRKLL